MTPSTQPPTFLTLLEVAVVFRISRSTTYRWISFGVLKAVKVRGYLRIPRTEVDRLQRDSFAE